MNGDKWNKRFMEMAKLVASWSKDPSTKVGAVIVDSSRRVIGTGYNGFPRAVVDDAARYEVKEVKYKLIVHSEANAILNAVKSVRDCTLYTTKYPCTDCTKLIIQSGIVTIVTPPPDSDGGHWSQDAKFSAQMFREAGVWIYHFDGEKAVLQ